MIDEHRPSLMARESAVFPARHGIDIGVAADAGEDDVGVLRLSAGVGAARPPYSSDPALAPSRPCG